jgi:hypothetical protein
MRAAARPSFATSATFLHNETTDTCRSHEASSLIGNPTSQGAPLHRRGQLLRNQIHASAKEQSDNAPPSPRARSAPTGRWTVAPDS